MIGEYETDENGKITVNELLKDKYILTETETPAGFVIKDADTVVNVEDFGADHSVTKTIVNPKEETTTATTTTTTTTTTEATTTSTTTTEAPTTTSGTTTEEKTGLPKTGKGKGTLVTIIGFVTLISSIILVAFLHKSKKD